MYRDDDDDALHCPACDGPLVLLGMLGRLEHCYCQDCGLPYSRPIPDDDFNPDDDFPDDGA